MQNGQVGVIILVLAVILSVSGGFLANAKDVTACKTDFNYVTDIAGAFSGTNADMGVEYNPIENITGYTVFDPTDSTNHANVVPGINTTNARSPNIYWIEENSGNTTSSVVTFTNNRDVGESVGPDNATMSWGTESKDISYLDNRFGVYIPFNNSVQSTRVTIDNWANWRVAALSVAQIFENYTALQTNSVIIQVNSSANGYPGFIADMSVNEHSEPGANPYISNRVYDLEYSNHSLAITVNPLTGNVTLNNQTYNWSQVYYVWGSVDSASASVTMMIGSTSTTKYIDPNDGIQPAGATTTNTTVISTTTSATQVSGSYVVHRDTGIAWNNAGGTFTITQGDSTNDLFTLSVGTMTVKINGNNALIIPTSGSSTYDVVISWSWNKDNPTSIPISLSARGANSSMTVTNGNIPAAEVTSIGMNGSYSTGLGSFLAPNTIEITLTDNTHSQSQQIGNAQSVTTYGGSLNTTSTQYETVTQTVEFTKTYWQNKFINSNMGIVVKKPSSGIDNNWTLRVVKSDDTLTDISLDLDYNTTSGWTVNDTSMGIWPGVYLEYSVVDKHSVIKAYPIDSFQTFTEYNVMDYVYTVYSDPSTNVKGLKYITFNNTDRIQLYHEIVSTTVLLEAGGLYTQDGVFSPATSFPADKIIQFRITGSPHAGDSVTVSTYKDGTYTPHTYLTNELGTGFIISGQDIPFADAKFYYVSDTVEDTVVGTSVFAGGLYLNNQFYEKGHLYLQTYKNGVLIDLGETTNQFTIKLDGIWAVATAYYNGENVASTKIEWDQPGTWHWDKTLTLIVFIGAVILALICCSRIWDLGWFDWAISICACVIALMLLG